MSMALMASNDYLGLPEPTILTTRVEHRERHLGNREFNIIKYDRNDPESAKVRFYVEEDITTIGDPPEKPEELSEYREKLPKHYKTYPWDVVIIMTKKWLLVVRPKPQQAELIVQKQAHDIWEQVGKLLEDDEYREEIDTVICWVLYPEGDITTKIHDDNKPLPTDRRMEIYKSVLGERIQEKGWPNNMAFESRPYLLGKTSLDSREAIYRSQIVVHHLEIVPCSSLALEQHDYEAHRESDYAALGFPPISLNTQATTGKGDGYAEAVVTSRMVWSTQQLITSRD
jgi:hypothetical protein